MVRICVRGIVFGVGLQVAFFRVQEQGHTGDHEIPVLMVLTFHLFVTWTMGRLAGAWRLPPPLGYLTAGFVLSYLRDEQVLLTKCESESVS